MERYTMSLDWKNKINIVKVTTLPKATYRFSAIHIKLPRAFFTEPNVILCMETQKTPNRENNLEKEEWTWRNQAPWLQIILQSYSHQNGMVLAQKQEYGSTEQVESPEIHPWTYCHLIYDKGCKNIQWEQTGSSKSDARKIGQLYVKKWNWNTP